MPYLPQARVWRTYDANLAKAETALSKLSISSGAKPTFNGLTGWVFEQTIRQCIRAELKARRLSPPILEQAGLGKRGKADLMVGNVAIEIKLSGVFSQPAIARYARYAAEARATGVHYLYIAGGESYQNYRDDVAEAFGPDNVFFLDRPGQWARFTERLARLLITQASASRPAATRTPRSGLTTRSSRLGGPALVSW